jgi:amino acid transporter
MVGFGVEPFSVATFGGFAPAGWGGVMTWSLLAVWLFVGISFPAPLIEETRKPGRNIPLAMFIGLVIIFVVQAILGFAVGGTMKPDAIFGAEPIPMVVAGMKFFGSAGMILFAAAALAAGFGTFNAVMAGTSRVLWGLGADGYLGKVIGYLHPRFKTPVTTLSIIFVILLILAFTVQDPVFIIAICSLMFLIVYLAMHIYLIVLRHKEPNLERPHYAGGPFKFPVLPILGIIGIVIVLYYTIALDIMVLVAGGIVAVVFAIISALVWFLYAKKKMSSG